MDKIEKLQPDHYGLYNPDLTIEKINELVNRINQIAKPLLVCRVSGRMLSRWEGDPKPIVDKLRLDIEQTVKGEYHVLCVVDDAVQGLMFEIHNQQSSIRQELIIQLENFKMQSENGEQA